LLVRGPGIAPGTVVDEPVGTIDVAPTALAAAGLDIPDRMEGRPLFDGPREHTITENDFDIGIRLSLRTLTTHRHKVTVDRDHEDRGELYDLVDDPGELVNRWADSAYASLRSDLVATLHDVVNPDVHAQPKVGIVG
jgi:arylsulfatase A-like enzyme